MRRIFIFGLGYTAKRIGAALEARGWEVVSTGREGTLRFDDAGNVRLALADAGHVLSSVPPGGEGADPVLESYADALGGKWLGYLSSTGVYGDTGGAWVDESAPTGSGRRTARATCGNRASESPSARISRGVALPAAALLANRSTSRTPSSASRRALRPTGSRTSAVTASRRRSI